MGGRVIFEGLNSFGAPEVQVKEFEGPVQFDWESDEWLVVEENDGTIRLFPNYKVITAVLDPPNDVVVEVEFGDGDVRSFVRDALDADRDELIHGLRTSGFRS